jgi:hypothetical protein
VKSVSSVLSVGLAIWNSACVWLSTKTWFPASDTSMAA